MKKISIAIATYNEEAALAKCLESVYGWVDEIVVVDGSSKDKTLEIAKKYTPKIIITSNPAIFHINKQKSIDACSGEWILQLDADEVVTNELKKEILEVIAQTAINGYWIPRKNYFLGQFLTKGGQYPDYSLRLYRKGKGRLPCKSVHEQAKIEGRVGYLHHALLHYPYPDFSHYLEHFNRYTDIFASELKEQKIPLNIITFLLYFFVKPSLWFLSTYFRHKGISDGFAGFVFSLFSSLRFPVSYTKYWEKQCQG